MTKTKWFIVLLNLLIVLVYFNYSILNKERLLKNGQLILLRLAPLDPRSLIQGDYMALRYDISTGIEGDKLPKRGYCVVKLNDSGVATRVRFQQDRTHLSAGEHLIEYTAPDDWNINIGAESYFFQEGEAEKFDKAKYGAVRVDDKGNSLLVGLYDDQLKMIR